MLLGDQGVFAASHACRQLDASLRLEFEGGMPPCSGSRAASVGLAARISTEGQRSRMRVSGLAISRSRRPDGSVGPGSRTASVTNESAVMIRAADSHTLLGCPTKVDRRFSTPGILRISDSTATFCLSFQLYSWLQSRGLCRGGAPWVHDQTRKVCMRVSGRAFDVRKQRSCRALAKRFTPEPGAVRYVVETKGDGKTDRVESGSNLRRSMRVSAAAASTRARRSRWEHPAPTTAAGHQWRSRRWMGCARFAEVRATSARSLFATGARSYGASGTVARPSYPIARPPLTTTSAVAPRPRPLWPHRSA